MEPVRRVVIPITFELIEDALRLGTAELKIVEILPRSQRICGSRGCEIVVEGPQCPLVHEGERYPTATLLAYNQPDEGDQVVLVL